MQRLEVGWLSCQPAHVLMQTKLTLIGLVVFLSLVPLFGATNDPAWKAGVASVVITFTEDKP